MYQSSYILQADPAVPVENEVSDVAAHVWGRREEVEEVGEATLLRPGNKDFEQVVSASRKPSAAYASAVAECDTVVIKMVDDGVGDFSREDGSFGLGRRQRHGKSR